MMNNHEGALTVSDYVSILSRRRWTALGAAAAVFGLLAAYAFLSTPVYRATTLLVIEKVSDVVTQTNPDRAPDEDYLATQAKLIVSETALRKVYDDLRLDRTEEFRAGLHRLRTRATVLTVPRTRLCQVNVESVDPKLAAAVSNALAQNYVKSNLDNQLFMPKHVLVALQTRAKGPDAEKIYESLPAVIENQLIQDIKGQILKGEVALAELKATYTDGHPAVLAMQRQLGLMRAARARELDNVVRSVTTKLSGQLRPNNVRIVDPAQPPPKPARPRKNLALVIGLIGGAIFGVLCALGLDGLDETVRTHTDLERKLGLPFLGEIPMSRPKKGERVYAPLVSSEETLRGEAFRDLRTMVTVARPPADKLLLVTSTIQQEGKSFVATNLAVALSQLGRKVLIIDGDLRRPAQHRNLSASAKAGLSDYLSGAAADPALVARRTDLANLDVIAAGKRPNNPSELLNTEQLAQLVEWARQRYDRVVVDCPPVFPVGDVLLWGRHVNAAILVSRAGWTRLPLVQMACERLRAGGIDVLGGVLNGARVGPLSYAYGLSRLDEGAAKEA